MSQETERRPLVAAILSIIQPGIGHLYLREWARAVFWAGLWAGSLTLVIRSAGVALSTMDLLAVVFGFFTLVEAFPIEAALALFAITMVSTLDAYWLAARNNHRLRSDVGRCPHCGKELEPTLEFCHWCTTPLDNDGQES